VDEVIYLIIDLVRRVRDGHWKRRKIPVWHFFKDLPIHPKMMRLALKTSKPSQIGI
jgi:hypothetical protein